MAGRDLVGSDSKNTGFTPSLLQGLPKGVKVVSRYFLKWGELRVKNIDKLSLHSWSESSSEVPEEKKNRWLKCASLESCLNVSFLHRTIQAGHPRDLFARSAGFY